jgi:hypothetical protein
MRYGKIPHALANVVSPRPHLFRIYDLRPPEELAYWHPHASPLKPGTMGEPRGDAAAVREESLDVAPPARWPGLPSETFAYISKESRVFPWKGILAHKEPEELARNVRYRSSGSQAQA